LVSYYPVLIKIFKTWLKICYMNSKTNLKHFLYTKLKSNYNRLWFLSLHDDKINKDFIKLSTNWNLPAGYSYKIGLRTFFLFTKSKRSDDIVCLPRRVLLLLLLSINASQRHYCLFIIRHNRAVARNVRCFYIFLVYAFNPSKHSIISTSLFLIVHFWIVFKCMPHGFQSF
jgi:hypothetical protein